MNHVAYHLSMIEVIKIKVMGILKWQKKNCCGALSPSWSFPVLPSQLHLSRFLPSYENFSPLRLCILHRVFFDSRRYSPPLAAVRILRASPLVLAEHRCSSSPRVSALHRRVLQLFALALLRFSRRSFTAIIHHLRFYPQPRVAALL